MILTRVYKRAPKSLLFSPSSCFLNLIKDKSFLQPCILTKCWRKQLVLTLTSVWRCRKQGAKWFFFRLQWCGVFYGASASRKYHVWHFHKSRKMTYFACRFVIFAGTDRCIDPHAHLSIGTSNSVKGYYKFLLTRKRF